MTDTWPAGTASRTAVPDGSFDESTSIYFDPGLNTGFALESIGFESESLNESAFSPSLTVRFPGFEPPDLKIVPSSEASDVSKPAPNAMLVFSHSR